MREIGPKEAAMRKLREEQAGGKPPRVREDLDRAFRKPPKKKKKPGRRRP